MPTDTSPTNVPTRKAPKKSLTENDNSEGTAEVSFVEADMEDGGCGRGMLRSDIYRLPYWLDSVCRRERLRDSLTY